MDVSLSSRINDFANKVKYIIDKRKEDADEPSDEEIGVQTRNRTNEDDLANELNEVKPDGNSNVTSISLPIF